jgi:hypothetical protein
MIPGLTSSGIASAMRTASKARVTMDDMSRQIATGQRVSGVKDDGASWARVAALKSDLARNEARRSIVANLGVAVETQTAHDTMVRGAMEQAADIVLRAMGLPPGSAARSTLLAEWQHMLSQLTTTATPQGAITTGQAWQPDGYFGVQGPTGDSLLGNRTVWTTLGFNWTSSWPTIDPLANSVPMNAIDIVNGSAANLSAGLNTIRHIRDVHYAAHDRRNDEAWLDSVSRTIDRDDDRLHASIGALTDADMGKASTARANAETRQQLAVTTVRQAISTYEGFATGLLGNVQRTQRGVMA